MDKPELCIGSCHEATKAPENRAVGFSPRGPQAKACGSDWRSRGTRHGSAPANVLLSTLRMAEGYPLVRVAQRWQGG